MQEAMRNWYFDLGNRSMQYTYDDCAETGSGLPCTSVDPETQQSCPHFRAPPGPGPAPGGGVTPQCLAELSKDCPGLQGSATPGPPPLAAFLTFISRQRYILK